MTEDTVLETLRRIPDRIILAVAARDLELDKGDSCLCGWFIRESLAEMQNVGASTVPLCDDSRTWPLPGVPWAAEGTRSLFGGTWKEWNDIYAGVVNSYRLPTIERAYVRRLDEACGFPSV